MSEKEAAILLQKSRQIPRLFKGKPINRIVNGNFESSLLESAVQFSDFKLPYYNLRVDCGKIDKNVKENGSARIVDESAELKSREAAATVADIEKWLKTRTEPDSSMDLESMKAVVDGVDLGVELSPSFLRKDADSLSLDIDLTDKKLTLGYDPILHELQSEKLLATCEKDDEFILPAFQLDHLDPLDMMVAGEILPSTSSQSILNIPNVITEDSRERNWQKQTAEIEGELIGRDKPVLVDIAGIISDKQCLESINNNDFSAIQVGNVYRRNELDERAYNLVEPRKLKAKMKPRIIKRPDKKQERLVKRSRGENNKVCPTSPKNSRMAVVAISTDKTSNMTQIVINTGKEEQVYQGKTSELIEATEHFPKLPKLDTNVNWDLSDSNEEGNNHHELIITKALEEVGITDDILQPLCSETGKVWVCPRDDCNRQFNKPYALKGHLLSHYGVRPFKCDVEGCVWAFYSEFRLKRHKETHLKRKDFVCQVEDCNRRFTTIYNLWSHEKLHKRPNKLNCNVSECPQKFQTKRALELHMKSHDQSHAPYVCKQEGCGKRYYSSNALTSHQRCHNYKESDIRCSWPGCGKLFDKPCRLKAHTRSHTGCKPYTCTFQGCQWAFSSSSKLKRHEKKHTNDRRFVCTAATCGKAFMRSEHLKEHILTHKQGRYFQCHICNAQFSAKSSLYVHIKKHQNDTDDGECPAVVVEATEEKKICKAKRLTRAKKKPLIVSLEATTENLSEDAVSVKYIERSNDELDLASDLGETTMFPCPMDSCPRTYATEATLKVHISKVHAPQELEEAIAEISNGMATETSQDYVASLEELQETSMSVDESEINAIILEQPPAMVSTNSPSAFKNRLPQQKLKKEQGSARTSLTIAEVRKLKPVTSGLDSVVVGPTDVILSSADLAEGLLLTEELPSLYYQDDIAECQVLLLDNDHLS